VLFFKTRGLPASLETLIPQKRYPLRIPTYEKSYQAVHPDLLVSANGPPFILSCTPYPFSLDVFENPSVFVSSNGISFAEEFPGINPLAPAPPFDHNDDPDLFWYKGAFHILYLETLRPEKQHLALLSSAGRKTWVKKILHTAYLAAGGPFMLSPAFFQGERFGSRIYYVAKKEGGNTIEYVSVPELPDTAAFTPDFSARRGISLDMGHQEPWHIDLIGDANGGVYMLICCVTRRRKADTYGLYIARGTDGASWEWSPKPVLLNAYRSSGFIREGDLYVYYSRQTPYFGAWELGVVRLPLKDYF
jgi:hypothetical protein